MIDTAHHSLQAHEIARRVAWFKEPAQTLAQPDDFLCRVMTWGTWEDCQTLLEQRGQDAFLQALSHAPAGVMDARSWSYWHHRFGLPMQPLPVRRLPE